MKNYKYTDKLLLLLAVGNFLIIVPSLYTFWGALGIMRIPHTDNISQFIGYILSHAVIETLLFVFFAWFFYKRRGFMLFFYIPYRVFSLPIAIYALIFYWQNNPTWSFIDSKIYCWWSIILFLIALLTLISMMIETDYPELRRKIKNSYQRLFSN